MFDHLVEDNQLKPVMKRHGLKLPQDLVFIREQIVGPSKGDAGQTQVSNGGVAVRSFISPRLLTATSLHSC